MGIFVRPTPVASKLHLSVLNSMFLAKINKPNESDRMQHCSCNRHTMLFGYDAINSSSWMNWNLYGCIGLWDLFRRNFIGWFEGFIVWPPKRKHCKCHAPLALDIQVNMHTGECGIGSTVDWIWFGCSKQLDALNCEKTKKWRLINMHGAWRIGRAKIYAKILNSSGLFALICCAFLRSQRYAN